MMDFVLGIEGRSPEGRRTAITTRLDSLGVPFMFMPFDTTIAQRGWSRRIIGQNIIVRMGSAPPTLVVGAHYDAVERSPGANDNGGGVAVILMLIAELRSYRWNGSVEFVFFDQEEVGLVGSAVYVARAVDLRKHTAMVNLDVVGTGDILYVGPVGGGDDDRIMPVLRRVARKAGLLVDEREGYPGSDHQSFARAGLENISLSVMPRGALSYLDRMMNNEDLRSEKPPEILAVMHTPQDSSRRVSAEALHMAYTLVRGLVLELDSAPH